MFRNAVDTSHAQYVTGSVVQRCNVKLLPFKPGDPSHSSSSSGDLWSMHAPVYAYLKSSGDEYR